MLSPNDHTNIDRRAEKWSKDMANWLSDQKERGRCHISKEMLDKQIDKLKKAWKLTDAAGVPLLGGRAEVEWPGKARYLNKLRNNALRKTLLAAGKKTFIKAVIPGLGVFLMVQNVEANGLFIGVFNSVSPIEADLVETLSHGVHKSWDDYVDGERESVADKMRAKTLLDTNKDKALHDLMREIYGSKNRSCPTKCIE